MDPAPITAIAQHFPVWALVLVRLTAFFASAPLLGGPWAPGAVRVLLAVAVTIAVAPQVAVPAQVPLDIGFIFLAAQEACTGLALGWLLSLTVQGVRMAGELINRYAGFQAAENFDPNADIGEGPFGDLLHTAIVMVLLAANAHLLLIASLIDSFRLVPMGAFAIGPRATEFMVHEVHAANLTALALSFPVLGAVMAITVAEGVLVRAVPQINVLHLSFAIKIGVSAIVMSACFPSVIAAIGTLVAGLGGTAQAAMRSFGT